MYEAPKRPEVLMPEITKSKELDLDGKVAIVTGSSRGIGKAIAAKLAFHGATVVVNSSPRSKDQGQQTVDAINQFGTAHLITADVTQEESGDFLIDQTIQKFGQLDVLVNNVGTTDDALLIRMTAGQWTNVMRTNLDSAFYVTKPAVSKMLKHGGSVVFVSSIAAHGNPGQANYSASKAGLEALAKTLAVEYARKNIRFNAVACGLADTLLTQKMTEVQKQALRAQVPMGRDIKTEEIADTVLFLVSDRASAITGQVLNVDGGMIR